MKQFLMQNKNVNSSAAIKDRGLVIFCEDISDVWASILWSFVYVSLSVRL